MCDLFVLQTPNSMEFASLYLKNIQEAQTFCRFREICFNIELENYRRLKMEMLTLVATLRETCRRFKFKISCYYMANNIENLSQTFEDKTKMLQSLRQDGDRQVRPKRHTEDISIFQKISEAAVETRLSHKNILNIITILKSISLANPKYIREYEEIHQDIFNMVSELRKYIHSNELVLQIMLQKNHQSLVELISSDALIKLFHKINAISASESCQLLEVENAMDLIKVLEASNIETNMIGNNFILSIKLATIRTQKYTLFRVIPLPFTYNNASFTLKPTAPYYLIGDNPYLNKTFIFALTTEEKLKCKMAKTLMCFPNQSMRIIDGIQTNENQILQKMEICTTEMIAELFLPTSYCTIMALPFQNKIISLTEETYYVYIAQHNNATVRCGNVTHAFSFSASRFIHLQAACSLIFENEIKLESRGFYVNTIFNTLNGNLSTNFRENGTSMDSLNDKNKSGQNYFLLSISIICLIILITIIILNIIQFTYCNPKTKKTITFLLNRLFEINVKPSSPRFDFNCSFTFERPLLPMKKHKSEPDYDVPRSLESIASKQSKTVHFADVHKDPDYATIGEE